MFALNTRGDVALLNTNGIGFRDLLMCACISNFDTDHSFSIWVFGAAYFYLWFYGNIAGDVSGDRQHGCRRRRNVGITAK